MVALLTTDRDGPADWVNAGQALQRILLTTAAYGAAVALHSQPLELPWLRESLRAQLSDGAYPQVPPIQAVGPCSPASPGDTLRV